MKTQQTETFDKYERLVRMRCGKTLEHMLPDPAVDRDDLTQCGFLVFKRAIKDHRYNGFSTFLVCRIRDLLTVEKRRRDRRGYRPSLSMLTRTDDAHERSREPEAPAKEQPFDMQQLMVRVSPLSRRFLKAFTNPSCDAADHMNKARCSGRQFFARAGRKLGFKPDEIKQIKYELRCVLPAILGR